VWRDGRCRQEFCPDVLRRNDVTTETGGETVPPNKAPERVMAASMDSGAVRHGCSARSSRGWYACVFGSPATWRRRRTWPKIPCSRRSGTSCSSRPSVRPGWRGSPATSACAERLLQRLFDETRPPLALDDWVADDVDLEAEFERSEPADHVAGRPPRTTGDARPYSNAGTGTLALSAAVRHPQFRQVALGDAPGVAAVDQVGDASEQVAAGRRR
jgi:hypothetical protein